MRAVKTILLLGLIAFGIAFSVLSLKYSRNISPWLKYDDIHLVALEKRVDELEKKVEWLSGLFPTNNFYQFPEYPGTATWEYCVSSPTQ